MNVQETLKRKSLIALYWAKCNPILGGKVVGIPLQIFISPEKCKVILKEYKQMFKNMLDLSKEEISFFDNTDKMKLLLASLNKYATLERFYVSNYLILNKAGEEYIEKLIPLSAIQENIKSFFEEKLKHPKNEDISNLLLLQTLHNMAQREGRTYFVETGPRGEKCSEEIITKAKEDFIKGLIGLDKKGMPKGIFPYFYSNSKGNYDKISYITLPKIKTFLEELIKKYGWCELLTDIEIQNRIMEHFLLTEIERINLNCRPASIYELSRSISTKDPHYDIEFVKNVRERLSMQGLLEYSDETQIIISPEKLEKFKKYKEQLRVCIKL